MTEKAQHPYNEAGRRLKAALLSYQMRYSGVDYLLKQMPETVEESWAVLAEKLLRGMQSDLAKKLMPPRDTLGDKRE